VYAAEISRIDLPFIFATDLLTIASLDGEEHNGRSTVVTCEEAITHVIHSYT